MTIAYIDQTIAPVKTFPAQLFFGGRQGGWYDPSDLSTLFQDTAGTVPVTADGQPVALMRDKSGNSNHLIQSVLAARPIYRTDGTLHWLEGDGTDDLMQSGQSIPIALQSYVLAGLETRSQVTTANASPSFGLVVNTTYLDLTIRSNVGYHGMQARIRTSAGAFGINIANTQYQTPFIVETARSDQTVSSYYKAVTGQTSEGSVANVGLVEPSAPISLFYAPGISRRFYGGLVVAPKQALTAAEKAAARAYMAEKVGIAS